MMTGTLHLSEKRRRLSAFTNSKRMDLFIAFNNIKATCFTFEDSTTSLMLDADYVSFTISNGNGSEVSAEKREYLGALEFCLKAFIIPASGSTCTVSISVFPGNLISLDAAHSPRHLDPSFPGIHLLKIVEVPLGVKAEHLTTKKYGAPIFPVLVTGSSIHETGSRNGPPREVLLYCIYSIMSRCTVPVCAREQASLLKKYEDMPTTGALPKNTQSFKWPTAEGPAENPGEP